MSTQQALKHIDKEILHLLKERICLLADTGVPPLQEQITCQQQLLQEVGIPHHLWEGVVTACMAVLAETSTRQVKVSPKQVTLVGGGGVMGQFFHRKLLQSGHQVRILEQDNWQQANKLLSGVDLVLLCVPLQVMESVIRQVVPYLNSSTALIDIASVKTPVVNTMTKCHKGPVMGLHPMFGPGVKSFLGQKIVVCPGRHYDSFRWFLEFIEQDGGKLINCTPEEHDQMMVAVQAIRHFSTFSLGIFLSQCGIDLKKSLDFASPIYRLELNMVSRLFVQEPSLYVDIMLASEERRLAIRQLADTCQTLAKLAENGDRKELLDKFHQAYQTFREDSCRTLQESNYMINSLSTFLTALDMEIQSQYA